MSANVALVCIFSPKLWVIFFESNKTGKSNGDGILRKRWSSRYDAMRVIMTANPLVDSEKFSFRSTLMTHEDGTVTQYTALLADQKRRCSRKSSSQPSPSVTSTAHDTFL